MLGAMRLVALILLVFLAAPAAALDLDVRRMLSAAESAPWKGVGRVNIATMRQNGMCTGTLIAPDLVLTAAHCLVDPATGEAFAPGNLHFVAGWRRGEMAAHRKAAAVALHPDYQHHPRPELAQVARDLAIIRLESAIPDEVAPSFEVGAMPPELGPRLTLISYRRDRAHALTRQRGCRVLDDRDGLLQIDCDVTEGVSGSPVFAGEEDAPRIVAIVSALGLVGDRPVAFAVRVDAAIGALLAVLP